MLCRVTCAKEHTNTGYFRKSARSADMSKRGAVMAGRDGELVTTETEYNDEDRMDVGVS